MKIGILTLPLHFNYGGILQAYALQTVLERMGHKVELIEKRRGGLPLWKMPLSYGKRILKNITGHPTPIFWEQKVKRETPIVQQHTNRFVSDYIHRRMVNDFSEIREYEYEAFVVGSDQIWRPCMCRQIGNSYLDFAKGWDVKRLSYAASFGTEEWEYTQKQTSTCGGLLKMFDGVSVREKSGVDLCRVHFGVTAEHVLDPTMLLSREDYTALIDRANIPRADGEILCYILDETEEKRALVDRISKEKGLRPFRANSKAENHFAPLSERVQPPVEQWLRGFCDAEFVVTDSFHACVFSILFGKPFVVVGNKSRGMSRFSSLLGCFGLEENLLMEVSDYNPNNTYALNDSVQDRLGELRIKSNQFLSNSLS